MRIRTCYRCLIARSCAEKRLLTAQLKALERKLTTVSFDCETKPTLLPPGSVVDLRLKFTMDAPGVPFAHQKPGIVTAIVRDMLPNGKLLLAVHPRSGRWFSASPWKNGTPGASLLGKCWPDQIDNIADLPFSEIVPVTACCGWPTFPEFEALLNLDPDFCQPWCGTCEKDRRLALNIAAQLTRVERGLYDTDTPF